MAGQAAPSITSARQLLCVCRSILEAPIRTWSMPLFSEQCLSTARAVYSTSMINQLRLYSRFRVSIRHAHIRTRQTRYLLRPQFIVMTGAAQANVIDAKQKIIVVTLSNNNSSSSVSKEKHKTTICTQSKMRCHWWVRTFCPMNNKENKCAECIAINHHVYQSN